MKKSNECNLRCPLKDKSLPFKPQEIVFLVEDRNAINKETNLRAGITEIGQQLTLYLIDNQIVKMTWTSSTLVSQDYIPGKMAWTSTFNVVQSTSTCISDDELTDSCPLVFWSLHIFFTFFLHLYIFKSFTFHFSLKCYFETIHFLCTRLLVNTWIHNNFHTRIFLNLPTWNDWREP